MPKAENARNYTQCDSMLIGSECGANTFPYIEVMNNTSRVEHEASTSKISEEQLFYLQQRGISQEDACQLDHQRFLQGCVPAAADGVCRRSAALVGDEARRQRWLRSRVSGDRVSGAGEASLTRLTPDTYDT